VPLWANRRAAAARWTAAQEIADLVEIESALGQYALHFQYLLINETGYSRQQLLKIRNIVSTLFLAEAHYDIKLLETELLNLYEREEDKEAVSLFLNAFKQLALYGKVLPEDYGQLDYVYRTKEEVQTMLAATLEQKRKKVYQAGWKAGKEEGKEEGKKEGRVETQRQTIDQLLQFRFELAEAEQGQYAQQVAKIQEVTHLDALVNALLNKGTTLEDFTELATKYATAAQIA
jgi:uncharacterized protein YqgQ